LEIAEIVIAGDCVLLLPKLALAVVVFATVIATTLR
jgi:hypothetical protein